MNAPSKLGEALVATGPAPGPACPGQDEIWALLEGELTQARAQAVVLHSVSCPACAFALQLGRELRADGEEPRAVEAPVRWRWLGAAAIAACIAVAFSFRTAVHPTPVLREADQAPLHALAGEGRVPRTALLLRWTELPAARYSVQLATRDLTPIWSTTGLAKGEIAVPQDALARLPVGARLVWRVTAQKQDGSTVTSPAFLLELE